MPKQLEDYFLAKTREKLEPLRLLKIGVVCTRVCIYLLLLF